MTCWTVTFSRHLIKGGVDRIDGVLRTLAVNPYEPCPDVDRHRTGMGVPEGETRKSEPSSRANHTDAPPAVMAVTFPSIEANSVKEPSSGYTRIRSPKAKVTKSLSPGAAVVGEVSPASDPAGVVVAVEPPQATANNANTTKTTSRLATPASDHLLAAAQAVLKWPSRVR